VNPEHWQHSKQLLQSISERARPVKCALSRDEQISMSESERWQQVKEVFHQALECAPGGRAAFIAEACAGDELLRAEVVFPRPVSSFTL
jgi:hypothetical protein